MNSGKTIFSQLMDFLSPYEFRSCVERYDGNYKVKSFSCWDQFLCMAFAQLTYRESLRDIQACLRAAQTKLYHHGHPRNGLPQYAGPCQSSARLAHLRRLRPVADRQGQGPLRQRALRRSNSTNSVYALDSTTIDLCLSLFPWAHFRKRKAAVKLHTLLDLRGSIPSVVIVTPGKVHDVNILDQLPIEPGAIYILDRGYLDFARLHSIHQASAFFVTRAKNTFRFHWLYSQPVTRSTAVRCDQIIVRFHHYPRKDYPRSFAAYGTSMPDRQSTGAS